MTLEELQEIEARLASANPGVRLRAMRDIFNAEQELNGKPTEPMISVAEMRDRIDMLRRFGNAPRTAYLVSSKGKDNGKN